MKNTVYAICVFIWINIYIYIYTYVQRERIGSHTSGGSKSGSALSGTGGSGYKSPLSTSNNHPNSEGSENKLGQDSGEGFTLHVVINRYLATLVTKASL